VLQKKKVLRKKFQRQDQKKKQEEDDDVVIPILPDDSADPDPDPDPEPEKPKRKPNQRQSTKVDYTLNVSDLDMSLKLSETKDLSDVEADKKVLGLYNARFRKQPALVRVTTAMEIVALQKCKKKTTNVVIIIAFINQHDDIPELQNNKDPNIVGAIYYKEVYEVLSIKISSDDEKKLIEDSKVLTVLHSIAVALNDLHSNNIVHGYVEPRHFLYNPKTFGVKIHDLGFSEPNPPQHYPPDIDPDVIESRIFKNNKLYSAVDTWALGVFLFKYLRQDKSDFGTTDPPDYSKYRGDDMSILTRCFEDESKMKDLSFFIKACIDAKTEKNTDKQKGKPKEKAPKDKDTEEETEEVENLLSEEKPKKTKRRKQNKLRCH